MAKYVAILVSLIFFVFSVNSYVPENKTEDPSLEIIKAEDAEEGVDFQQIPDTSKTSILRRRFLESLVCQDPKTPSNTVTFISGEPLHMSSKANVTCAAGKHFTGQYADKTMVTVTCTPLPHPCMCMAAWETGDDFQLMYDFNCTSGIEENIDKKAENTKDDLPIYPFPEKDDPQCPDPTPVRGTMRILHGHPFSYGCNVLLTCDPGLVFEDGKSVWNLTCLGLSVLPPQCIWVPVHDGRPICKDDLQCPNSSPIRGTLKVLSGKPFTDGCEVSIICDPGLVLSDGKTVWNLTCVPVAHIPPVLVWIPQYTGKPTCKEPSADKETTKSGKTEMLPTDEEVQGGALTTDDQSENVSSDNNSDVLTTDTEEETGKAVIETLKDKVVNDHNIDYSLAIPNNEQTDSFEPEEDLDGTFHENYIEATDNDSNYEITVPSDLEAHEESTNSISDSFSQKDSIETSYNEESENIRNKNQVYGEQDEKETEKTDNEFEHFMSKDEMLEKDIEEIQDEMVNENVKSSAQETLSEEIDYENIFEEEENTAEEQDGDIANQETELEEEEIEHEEETENEEDIENNEQNETEEIIESETDITNSESTREESEDDRSTEFTNSDDFEEETEAETDTEITQSEDIDEETETYTGNTQSENIEEETEPETDYDITQSENIEEETEPETDTDILKNENIEEEPEAETYTENKVKENDLEEEEEYETVEDEENNFNEEEEEEQLNNENETGILENHYANFEQDEDEDENNQERVLDEIHPLQPPAVKEPSIIYSAIRESNIFDKEEDEEEWENTNSDNLMFEDVEPPGYLLDIQKEPVEASIEEVRTNENACSLPAETGPCRAYFRRFFFNSKTKECDVFVYGGCNGNGNNFKTLNDCENACGRKNVTL